MLRIILMVLSLLIMIGTHIAANLLPLNGFTTWEIANRVPVLFMPAEYVFSIWVVLDLLLVTWLFSFFKTFSRLSSSKATIRSICFCVSCFLNIAWLLLWHYSYYYWAIVSVIGLLICLLIFYFSYPTLESSNRERLAISAYMAWIFIAVIANSYYAFKFHDWSGWGLSDPLWTVIFLSLTTAIALHFLYHYRDSLFNLIIIWSFIGIAIKNGTDELFVSTAALFLSAVIGFLIFIKKRQSPPQTF
ncbi:tryptophan-rich sensory protein [Sporosarcina sp. PTS2304]|uniref:tryptophan-rich sensory protein n=1 Tax=Sporosarcina sp. PTS2304 TaxID=2283194 RepID=UPI000E0DD1C7|nr:tryptophan-rich sensory protein [Sporosarcina sp. PTS2304]AXH99948.1 tryptophan-rich sensory protein [Sporosarcina sp. PTS2304]